MEVRHNTALLEQAIALVVQRASIPTRQAEAEAAEKLARAAARRRLATGAAIAVAAVGLGLGIMLGFWKPTVEERQITRSVQPPQSAEMEKRNPSMKPDISPVEPHPGPVPDKRNPSPPIINYTKFATTEIDYLGHRWTIEAGHHYATDTDKIWDRAWCYTRQSPSGILVQIDLAERDSPDARPTALIASPESLKRVDLGDASALDLATRCPWLDGKEYKVGDFSIPPLRNLPEAPNNPQPSPYLPSPPDALPSPNPPSAGSSIFLARDGLTCQATICRTSRSEPIRKAIVKQYVI